jgi:hypothetical protein
VIGVVLAIAWVVYANATRRSPEAGIFSPALCAGVTAAGRPRCILDVEPPTPTHVGLIVVAVVMIGMGWSHTRRRLTGQVDTDEVDTN